MWNQGPLELVGVGWVKWKASTGIGGGKERDKSNAMGTERGDDGFSSVCWRLLALKFGASTTCQMCPGDK
jgi:hypothetical protein